MRQRPRLAAVALVVGASAWALTGPVAHALPAPPLLAPRRWSAWLHTADPLTALVTLLRLATVALTGWLALAIVAVVVMDTAADGAETTRRSLRAVRAAGRTLHHVVPRPVLAAAALLLGVAAAGCARSPAGTGARSSVRPAITPPTVTMTMGQPGTGLPARTPSVAPSLPAASIPPRREPAGPTAWVVREGQSLWSIAEAVAGSRGATPAQVAGYWVALVRDNPRPDPDLIQPGEVLDLPPYQE
jgi:hypothetical protein